jgi:hypothetical protein
MSGLLAGLGSIFVTMLVKLLGYDFVVKIVVIGLESWAQSTSTDKDDQVVAAVAAAWGVDVSKVQKLDGSK